MKNITTYHVDKHKKLVIISMAIHNYIRRYCPTDEIFDEYDWHRHNYDRSAFEYDDAMRAAYQAQAPLTEDHDSDSHMHALRDIIRDNVSREWCQ